MINLLSKPSNPCKIQRYWSNSKLDTGGIFWESTKQQIN